MKLSHTEKDQNARPRVVVDTSILISATLTDGPYRRLVRELLTAGFEICIPAEVIEEYERITAQPKFKKYEPLFTQILEELKKSAILLPPASYKKYSIEGSEEDENIINCCVENQIDYLITYDQGTVGKYNGLEVIIATEFYSRFFAN
ncbi:putative toxin-antitoxin system toxin component, PIN family [Candidatus Daviesbacteria bacterium RIFCSPLOWO2_01_FULL_43_38]|uniref:PilT protein domain protein n=2 Tax=Candidatus Daviesiibacteriota TaxID=1752718 RepID=A0A0G1DFE5_9BACT|nr:MAG: PilT protein domain protein [Candidatus Daviesbacteria bacterium GW2011_GWA2_42_7]OGE34310.1 MAG: putative toxin-antitoxin system toxin component, PIN family [Candidatus Daviesbacteria bacterium RIFCSPHIGHO2_12_FULL_43_11]OGE63820.1 MAG: putative toxin-antitoxin system toxin component, PIN family [Candidatus Daviesbacteria bacterium RIFCSPLOWO2_01_FULL_43_38]OGE69117.1 MAG: putative toxin-antitoxin system toxin component, PIN family [Candidatus Daviesbacteria bacterium RIFCSPLOWO2_02_FUL